MLKPQVSPKSPLELKHGGDHLMLFGINKTLKPGNKTNLIFEFQTEDRKTFTKSFTFNIN
jgi:copper(I)-binding protein